MKKSLYIPACASLALVMGLSYADSATAMEQGEDAPSALRKFGNAVGLGKKVTEKIKKVDRDSGADVDAAKAKVKEAKKAKKAAVADARDEQKTVKKTGKETAKQDKNSHKSAKHLMKGQLADAGNDWASLEPEHQVMILGHINNTKGEEANEERLTNLRQLASDLKKGLAEGDSEEGARKALKTAVLKLRAVQADRRKAVLKDLDAELVSDAVWARLREKEVKDVAVTLMRQQKDRAAEQEAQEKRLSALDD